MDIVRTIIRWIILIVIFIAIVALIIHFAGKTEQTAKKAKSDTINIIENGLKDEDGLEPITEEKQETNNEIVDVQDTASSAIIETVIGTIIIGVGLGYIYSRRNVKGNS